MKLYEWQEADLATIRANGYVAPLFQEPGSGKTVVSVAAALECGAEQVLIIAPEATHGSAWAETAEAMGAPGVRRIGRGSKGEKAALADLEMGYAGWYITTPQFFTRADIGSWWPDMLIVDEIHQLGNPRSKGQKKLSGASKTDKPISLQATYRLALSGTPARNNFERMWSVTKFLWPERNGPAQLGDYDFNSWSRYHMDSVYSPFTPSKRKFTGEKVPGRLISMMPCVIQHFRRRRCCEWHPDGFLTTQEPQVIRESYALLPSQRVAIRDLQDQQLAWFGEHPLVTEIPITTQMRIRQVCLAVPTLVPDGEGGYSVEFAEDAESPLLDAMLSRMEQLDESEQVVVFCASQKFAALAADRFSGAGYPAMEFSGATKKTRAADLEAFKAGGFRVAVIVIQAGGTGLDGLQRVCGTEFWAERSLDRTDNAQAEARVDRLGAARQVQRFIFTDDAGLADKRLTKEDIENKALAKSLVRV